MAVHPAIGNTSWGLPLRVFQFIFAVLVMSLSAYTLSKITGWKEVRFTVGASVWSVLSLVWILTSGMIHRPKSHHYITLVLEFINWGLFLAIWIALSVNIGRNDQCVAPDGGHDHSRPCNTIYTALAFAIVDWLLFTVTFFTVGWAIFTGKEGSHVHEKNAGNTGGPIRPSDDGTLRGESAA
jgi:hypothetical protein